MSDDKITLNHGSGGRQMHELVSGRLLSRIGNKMLDQLDDSAVLDMPAGKKLAFTTDSYVVDPIFFPGGDIGKLCVCGTVNDLSTSGAQPLALSLAFIIEEGFGYAELDRVIDSIAATAKEAGVYIATGDTKVVPRGKGDGLFINTSGIGAIREGVDISSHNAKPGDCIIVTGPVGKHEISLLKARGSLPFDFEIESDLAPMNIFVNKVLDSIDTDSVHCIKDPTRGGLASALYEIADHSGCEIKIDETRIPVSRSVKGVCDLLGYDPLYLANEGTMIVVCGEKECGKILEIAGEGSRMIGSVSQKGRGIVNMETEAGGIRRIGMLETVQLPRIC